MPSDFKCRSVCRANRIFRQHFQNALLKPQFNCFEIIKANIVKYPKRVMTISLFPDVSILRGQNHESIMHEKFVVVTLSGFLTILAFKISQKFNFGLEMGTLKICLKILLALHTVLHLKSDVISVPK